MDLSSIGNPPLKGPGKPNLKFENLLINVGGDSEDRLENYSSSPDENPIYSCTHKL